MQRPIRLLGTIIIVVLVAGSVELMAYVATRYFVKYPIGFTPLHITETYKSYEARYDRRLAWKSIVLDDNGNYRDLEGSSPAAAGPDQSHAPDCVALYGDSFTEGYGVSPQDSWCSVLSHLLHCQVANFGVAGYGTDQAYLRFLDNRRDRAKVVILGFLSENKS